MRRLGDRDGAGLEGVFVIAEAGVNHNGDLALARRLVDAAREAGADAVKFQTFRPAALASPDARKAAYQDANAPESATQRELLEDLALDAGAHRALMDHCREAGIEFMSTPFEEASADLLVELGVGRLKVGSGELTHLPFLRHLATTGLPLILSTGMSDLVEVAEAVACVREAGVGDLTLLHCLTDYPAPKEHVNLRAMDTLRAAFGVPVGFSDHTEGIEVSVAAAARGAAVIEKHLTLDRALPGPDHAASLEPETFSAMVEAIHNVTACLGDGRKVPAPCEEPYREVVRRGLVAVRDLSAGAPLRRDDVAILRPATGIAPRDLERVLGIPLARGVPAGSPVRWDDLRR